MKRFTDTDIWKRPWFRELTPAEKCAFQYIRDNCDNAGVWIPDFSGAEFNIGEPVDWESLHQHVNKNIHVLESGKWWISDFCEFQFGELHEDTNNKAHKSHIALLKKHGLWPLQGHHRGPLGVPLEPQEKEKEKETVKVKEKVTEKAKEKETPPSADPRWAADSIELLIWHSFEKEYGSFIPDIQRNRDAIDKILHMARERGDPEPIVKGMMEKLKELKNNDNSRKGFWRDQPFLPMTLVSLFTQVWEKIRTETEPEEDIPF